MSAPNMGRRLLVTEKVADPSTLNPKVIPADQPEAPEGHAVIAVQAAAVNPSDVKAAMGLMPHAVWPRTPGRDYAGTVVAGPKEWLGVEVWGTGGDLGVTCDGTHATHLVLPVSALSRKPDSVPTIAAATVGVPFITAGEGLRRAGLRAGQQVVVFGANGKVGQAAVQLATRAGATVIGVDRGNAAYLGHASSAVRMLDGEDPGLVQAIQEATAGKGADIAYNTVGSPYFQAALDALATGGTQVLISTIEKTVPFDILSFYRRNLQMLGVDSLKLTATHCAQVLDELRPGFVDGSLQAFSVEGTRLYGLEQAGDAYRNVLAGSIERVVLVP